MHHTESKRRYDLGSDTILEFRTVGDRPDRLVSVGLDLLVFTEAHMIPDAAVTELRPTLISPSRCGIWLSTGIPSAMPWCEDFKRRADDGDPRYWYYTGPSSENPYIDKDDLQAEIDATPEYIRGPLYLGQWPTGEGSVFRNIDRALAIPCANHELPIFTPATGLVFDGLDPARLSDFMVYVALERRADGKLWQVGFDRYNKADWAMQFHRAANATRQWRSRRGFMDATGIGDVVKHDLDRMSANFYPFKFTPQSKEELINNLALALDNDQLRLFNLPVIRDELRRFRAETLAAPEGHHDDVIMALALSVWAVSKAPRPLTAAQDRLIRGQIAR